MKLILFILFSIIPLGIYGQNDLSMGAGTPMSDILSTHVVVTGKLDKFIVGSDFVFGNRTISINGGDIPGNQFDVQWIDWGYLFGYLPLEYKYLNIDFGARIGLGIFDLNRNFSKYSYGGLYNLSLKNYVRVGINAINSRDFTLSLFVMSHFSGYSWSRLTIDKAKLYPNGYKFGYDRTFIGLAINF